MSDDFPTAIPAATLVLFRDGVDRPPLLLMVQRSRSLAFAGGAWVFPGGRVDDADRDLAGRMGGDVDDLAARIAAMRETIEEVGVAVGLSPSPDAATLAKVRAALHAGTAFADAIAPFDLALDPDLLVPYARWCPRHHLARIFDTRFYLARWPDDAPEPQVDASENSRLRWTTASAMLDAADKGEADVIFPTRRNLERLALHTGFDDAAAHAARHPVTTITPWSERRADGEHLCIPADAGYPVTSERLERAMRGG